MKIRSLIILALSMTLILAATGLAPAENAGAAPASGEAFPSWNENAPALNALLDYVENVTDESSPDHIPEADRIAVFDLDGTLMCETCPRCFEYMVFVDFVLNNPDYSPTEDVLAVAREIEDTRWQEKPSGISTRQAAAAAVAYAGMTPAELGEYVKGFMDSEAEGFTGMTRGEAFFLPMKELVNYLRDHGFTVYIVTATERNIVRALVGDALGIGPAYVIGTEYGYTATGQGDIADGDYTFTASDKVVFDGTYYGENAQMSKVDAIVREIGRQPVLAFGNSSGDLAMEIYTISGNPYRSAAYMVLADDEEREYGNAESAAAKKASYESMGIGVISMRDDFKTIYGDGVVKTGFTENAAAETEPLTLERVVILSRHNIRSPFSGTGSLLGDITPHEWFRWTSDPGELSLRGGIGETIMGQYFRLWLEKEGLFPENYQPEEGAVRFYANAKQRTLATARYFSAGLLPVSQPPIECHAAYDTMDPVFEPSLHFVTEEYARDVLAQIAGENGLDGIAAGLNDAVSLLMDTADIEQSESYQAGKYGDLLSGETELILTEGKEPVLTGPIKTATSVADAMTLQYYEEADEKKAAFGHELTLEDWQLIHSIVDTYTDILFCSPLVSVNAAHPLLMEIRAELTAAGRKVSFLCGHDSNVASVLAALGAEDYLLPETVEQHTPIGVKLVFERWAAEDGKAFYKIDLVYQSARQLRTLEQLTPENPPVIYPLRFEGTDADGLIAEEDLFSLLDGAIDAYDALTEKYAEAADEAA